MTHICAKLLRSPVGTLSKRDTPTAYCGNCSVCGLHCKGRQPPALLGLHWEHQVGVAVLARAPSVRGSSVPSANVLSADVKDPSRHFYAFCEVHDPPGGLLRTISVAVPRESHSRSSLSEAHARSWVFLQASCDIGSTIPANGPAAVALVLPTLAGDDCRPPLLVAPRSRTADRG